MATPRHVCHRCRHKWKVKRGVPSQECPKCGHDNVGPTDPAPSPWGKLLLGVALAVGVAWYLDLLPGEAKQALDDAREAVESTVDDVRREVEGPAPRTPAKGEERRDEPAQETETKPRETQTRTPPPPAPAEGASEAPPRPQVVVASKSGAQVGSAYLVKGKVKNTGGAAASGVKVVVTFLDAGGATLSEVEAQAPTALEPGAAGAFEAAVAGAQAGQVESFTVRAAFDP